MSVLIDHAARERTLDPGASFIVQAPAGSGKTELLTRRILALLATVETPEEILAITFTRKAAQEMRERLLQALEAAKAPPPAEPHRRRTWELARAVAERDRALGWDLAASPARLGIQTIDGFNAMLVRRMPWVSRFGGMPRMATDPERLYREAARRVLDRDGGEGAAAVTRLLDHLDNRVDHLEEMLVALLQRRDQWLRHLFGPAARRARESLQEALGRYLVRRLEPCRRELPAESWPRLLELARYAAANVPDDHPIARLRGLEEPPPAEPDALPAWQGLAELVLTRSGSLRRRLDRGCGFPPGKNDEAAAMKTAMAGFLEEPEVPAWATTLGSVGELPLPLYGEDQWQVLQALVELLRLAVAELWLVFSAAGEADFAEVALRALEGLGREEMPSDLLLLLDARLSHILVDEFQDTSYLQYALLQRLTAGWQPGDGRTLFLVGDPMQSIYRFREAEVGLFLQARRQGIGGIAPEPLVLEANFRSAGDVVAWINQSFAGIFPPREDVSRGAVPYAPAVPVHPAGEVPAVTVLPQAERDAAAEARLVLDAVRGSLARGESVAILVRARNHLSTILETLRAAGLKYLAQDVDALSGRSVARDLVALTRALLHSGDRLAWCSVLRAPWTGLELGDLHALCSGRPDTPVPALLEDSERLNRMSPEGRLRARRAAGILGRGREQRGRVSLRRLVEGCWLALGGPACCSPGDLEDAQQVFELLESLDRGGDLDSFERLEASLERLYAAPDSSADGRLQVMTIHKAKGLEFDTVILPGLGLGAGRVDAPLLRWAELPGCGLLLAPVHPRNGQKDAIYDAIGRLESEKEALEAARLLYVAATRARKRLVLAGHAPATAEGTHRPRSGSLLDLLWPAVAEAWRDLPATASAAPDFEETPPPLERLPVDWQPPVLESAPLPPGREAVPPSHAAGESPQQNPAGRVARLAGTILHLLLERVAREGLEYWDAARIAGLSGEVATRLEREGLVGTESLRWQERILAGLGHAIGGKNGRWVLARRGLEAGEVAVSSPEVAAGVVDRTFVDAEETRWVIDYKTSEPRRGESLGAFYRREADRYRPQLAAYARLFEALEPGRTVRCGLYFPLVDGWAEVAVG